MPPVCQCGKELEDKRGAKGHVKFTDEPDGIHGPIGSVPDNWQELFDDKVPPADEDEQEDAQEADEDEDDENPTDERSARERRTEAEKEREKGRLREILTTPINELF